MPHIIIIRANNRSALRENILMTYPLLFVEGEGSVVECLTQYRGIADSSLTGDIALCP